MKGFALGLNSLSVSGVFEVTRVGKWGIPWILGVLGSFDSASIRV
jgi:hypothetical protein